MAGERRASRWIAAAQRAARAGLFVVVCAQGQGLLASQDPSQTPRFRASVEVTSIDVAVVDSQGRPVAGLMPSDFSVRIDGKPRAVVSAEWVSETPATATPALRALDGYSSNENSAGGRLIAIAVDEPHIRPGGAAAVLAAASAFIDRLPPSDRIAVVSLGLGGPATPFIADRQRVKDAIGRMAGQRPTLKTSTVTVTASEALEIADGSRVALDLAVARECAGMRAGSAAMQACRQEVENEALQLGQQLQQSGDLTVRGLRDVLTALQGLDGPKTLILMSEGFALRDEALAAELGGLAAAARTSIYALKLDPQLFELMNARMPLAEPVVAGRSDGLEAVAAAARGTLFNVNGTGSQLFARIESELSGYYLLGVESDPADRDGRPHPVRVDVLRRGATVRSRRQLLNARSDVNRPKTARDAVAASLTSPLLASGLPLRLAAFALRGPDAGKVQLLIRADVGADYTAPRPVTVGYVIQDAAGRIVDSRTVVQLLGPAMNGVPGALQYVGGASVEPGEYTIKLAAAEGDRVGSVEHAVRARLSRIGPLETSELIVGGPAEPNDPLRPSAGYTVSFGTLQGYLEVYGPGADGIAATYEVAAAADGPPLLSTPVEGRTTGEGRTLFSQMLGVRQLPPGEYVLRARLAGNGRPLATLTRRFEIAAPPVLMTSASGVGDPASVSADLFLPVDEGALAPPFARDAALAAPTLEPFLKRVPASVRSAFDEGLRALGAADYASAVGQFKRAIRPDEDSTAALGYLGVSLAAAGQASEAAGVWQTALVDGADIPQLFVWLSEAYLRLKDLTAAKSVLEEAVGRWPSDGRFVRPLAFVYALLGRGREALRLLDRYIAAAPSDLDALFLGVQWIFQAHSNRAVVTSAGADLAMARSYAVAYEKANGPRQALVRQWIEFLEHEPGR